MRGKITLTQHVFACEKPGRLYLDEYEVPMRSELERDIVTLLRRCLAQLREQAPAGESGSEVQAIPFGSSDLAQLRRMSPVQEKICYLQQIIAYVESDQYGKMAGGQSSAGPDAVAMVEAPRNPAALRRYWFRRPVGFGYGVTAFTVEDAERLLARAGLPSDWVEVVADVDVSTLDAEHVLPNIGGVTFRGVWYPALNL